MKFTIRPYYRRFFIRQHGPWPFFSDVQKWGSVTMFDTKKEAEEWVDDYLYRKRRNKEFHQEEEPYEYPNPIKD